MSKKLQVGGGLLILGITNLLIAGTAFAGASVNDVQQAITAKHAGWTAKENWVTQLPREQVIRMMGVQKAPNHDAEFMIPEGSVLRKAKLPPSVDWRNVNGVNYVSPILNQGNCGSCVAFSTVATLETQLNVSSGIPGLNAQFSTQALFSCGGGACDFGWEPDLAAQYLKTTGVPDEACSPYTEGATGVDVDCSSICSDHAARSYKIADFTAPTANVTNIDAVKAALQNGPL
jgi:C1A family cysteine protease